MKMRSDFIKQMIQMFLFRTINAYKAVNVQTNITW